MFIGLGLGLTQIGDAAYVPRVPAAAVTWADGTVCTWADGTIVEWSASL